ncbi:MAG: ABC transporter substrate-binding protein [Spirochaetales bacterium]|nr:ABC transporter substrate-binding protein [Spirochaetales bacterium]MCF7938955.1 ABC transporter substrate-binding protein [Spirochaetales bacterium]
MAPAARQNGLPSRPLVPVFRRNLSLSSGVMPFILLVLASCCILASCGEPQPYRVGFLTSRDIDPERYSLLSGTFDYAIDSYQKGRVAGSPLFAGGKQKHERPVEMVPLRMENRPESVIEAARRLINQEGVQAIIGPLLSNPALQAAKVAETAGIPLIVPTATNPEITEGRDYVFRACADDRQQAAFLSRYINTRYPESVPAVIYLNGDNYSTSVASRFIREFESLGGSVRPVLSYTRDTQDELVRELSEISAAGSELVFLPLLFDDLFSTYTLLRASGFEGIVFGPDSWDGITADELPMYDNTFYATYWSSRIATEANMRFVGGYKKRFQQMPASSEAMVYDSVFLLLQALERAGSTDPAAVAEGLRKREDFSSLSGLLEFDENGNPQRHMYIHEIINGLVSPVPEHDL